MLKKTLALALTVLMLLACLASCNSSKATLEPTETEPTEAPTETQKPSETKKPTSGNNTNTNNNNNNNNNSTNKNPVFVDRNVDDSKLVIPEGPDIFKERQIKLADTNVSQFTIIIPGIYTAAEQSIAYDLADWIEEITEKPIQVISDDAPVTAHEILIGATNRAESTEVTKNGFANNYAFSAKFTNGKLAIAAGHSDGYYVAQQSFMKVVERCKGQLNCDFSNQTLSNESMMKISTGAVQIDSTPTGLKYYKCTPAQEAYWAQAHSGAAGNAKAANGCRLDFDTNSSTVYFEVTAGNCVFLLNGKQIATGIKTKFYRLPTLDGYKEGTNRITIILPGTNNQGWQLSKVWLDSGAETKRHEYDLKMLFLGDSITQGYNNMGNEANTYTFYTSEYFNAESVVQGNGGAVFDPKYLVELDYEPDVILVAYGCNDWSRYRGSNVDTIMQKVKAYFDKLVSLYPNTPIIAISPIYRYDLNDHNASVDFRYMNAIIEDVCYSYNNVTVVDGFDFVPHSDADRNVLWYDDIHPNGTGFIEYGKSLTAAIKTQIEAIIAAKSNS